MILDHMDIMPGQGHDAGRILLEQMYREATGQPMPKISVTERGKPYFPDSSLQFSITHTKHHVFCVLSEKPIGIDAEETDRQINPALAEKILSVSEKLQFDKATDKRMALLTFWVLKEAASKCSGQGLKGYPKDTAFSLDDPRVSVQHDCLVAVIAG